MTEIKKVDQAIEVAKSIGKNTLSSDLIGEFNSIFKEATAAAANVDVNEWAMKEKRKKNAEITNTLSLENIDRSSLAQLNQGVVQNAANANAKDVNIVPLQIFLDNAIRSLGNVSQQEARVNQLMDQFTQGTVSEDEVVLETAKLNLSISMVTTIVQSAVQTFKEIQQIPV
jgi:flagellar hook-basal body complex protein FliE